MAVSSGGDLDHYIYVYDPANQRTNLTRTDSSTVAFKYDNIGQLKIADSSVNTEDRGYVYDSAWNLNWRTNNTSASQFQVDNKNQLTNAPLAGAMAYDDNGNLRSNTPQHWWYEYDDENRLVNWYYSTTGADPGAGPTGDSDRRAQFVYDGLGRLRKRVEYTADSGEWVNSVETRYIYDGMRVVQERSANNTPTVSYTRGNDLSGSLEGAGGIGGLLARSHGYSSGNWTTHNFYHADGNGNITYLVNSSQTLAASYRYDPFGNTISSSGTLATANVYRFSSKEIYVNVDFIVYYYGYRFYDPNLQRWINRDPIGERVGINLYQFLGNNPNFWIDPLGLQTEHCITWNGQKFKWDPGLNQGSINSGNIDSSRKTSSWPSFPVPPPTPPTLPRDILFPPLPAGPPPSPPTAPPVCSTCRVNLPPIVVK